MRFHVEPARRAIRRRQRFAPPFHVERVGPIHGPGVPSPPQHPASDGKTAQLPHEIPAPSRASTTRTPGSCWLGHRHARRGAAARRSVPVPGLAGSPNRRTRGSAEPSSIQRTRSLALRRRHELVTGMHPLTTTGRCRLPHRRRPRWVWRCRWRDPGNTARTDPIAGRPDWREKLLDIDRRTRPPSPYGGPAPTATAGTTIGGVAAQRPTGEDPGARLLGPGSATGNEADQASATRGRTRIEHPGAGAPSLAFSARRWHWTS